MKTKILITFAVFFCIATTRAQQYIQYPALKKQIDSLATMDREASRAMISAKPGTMDSLRAVFRKITVKNEIIVKELFNKYGFLNYDMVGNGSSNNFWLIVQHADNDVPFQVAVLEKMKVQIGQKKADPTDFAYLTDRVNINTGKPQIYGTQLSNKLAADGTQIPKNMIDPENVNKRRKEIGLGALEDYLKIVKELTTRHN